jgi:hypothetical protein
MHMIVHHDERQQFTPLGGRSREYVQHRIAFIRLEGRVLAVKAPREADGSHPYRVAQMMSV